MKNLLLIDGQVQVFPHSAECWLLLWTVGGSNVLPDTELHNKVICTHLKM